MDEEEESAKAALNRDFEREISEQKSIIVRFGERIRETTGFGPFQSHSLTDQKALPELMALDFRVRDGFAQLRHLLVQAGNYSREFRQTLENKFDKFRQEAERELNRLRSALINRNKTVWERVLKFLDDWIRILAAFWNLARS